MSSIPRIPASSDIAGSLGIGRDVERGPGRHGPPNGILVYFRDPGGHRLEFILPMQTIDLDEFPSNEVGKVALRRYASTTPVIELETCRLPSDLKGALSAHEKARRTRPK